MTPELSLMALWLAAAALIIVGLSGVVLPVLPGIPVLFGGLLLVAWIDDFQRIGMAAVVLLGVLAVLSILVDLLAGILGAKKVGASPQALWGTGVGTVLGLFTGFVGLIFAPLLGAAAGEWLARGDSLQAGKVGLATWLGLLIATVAKVAIAFMMLGIALAAYFF